jgi:hypothetical protein
MAKGELPEEQGEYEFSDAENRTLRAFAHHALGWGALCLLVALASLGLGAARFLEYAPGEWGVLLIAAGVVLGAEGMAFASAGRSFLKATSTRGNDIAYTMRALGEVARALMIQVMVGGLCLGLVAIAAMQALR